VLAFAYWPITVLAQDVPDAPSDTFYLIARIISAGLSVATVYIVFLIGRLLAGSTVGLVAAALLATVPLHVKYAHYTHVDVPATFFMVLTLWAASHAWKSSQLKWYVLTGIFTGVSGATQYWGFTVGAALLLAHAANIYRNGFSTRMVLKPAFLLSLLLIPVTFFVLSSGSFLDPESRAAYHKISARGRGGDLGYTRPDWLWPIYNNSQDWAIPFTSANIIVETGIVVTGLAMIGLAWAWRDKKWAIVVMGAGLCLIVFLAINGTVRMYAVKRLLFLSPLLTLLAAYGVHRLWRFSRPLAAGIFLVALVMNGWNSLSFSAAYAKESSVKTAKAWFEEHLPHEATVLQHTPVELVKHDDQRWKLLRMDQIYSNLNAEDPEAAYDRAKPLNEWVGEQGVEFIVLDSRMVDKYYDPTTEKLFPETAASYQLFFNDIRSRGKRIYGVWPQRWKIAGPWIEVYEVKHLR
ncbi:MAG: glycosyltransferase family 39 protein, partial [Candidatus Andersenbacteria bacterium]